MNMMIVGIGMIVLLISLLADPIGLGGYPGFGWKQAIGLATGIVILILGLIPKRKITKYDNLVFISIGILLALFIRYSLLSFESADYRFSISQWFDFIQTHKGFKAMGYNFSNYTPPYLYLLTLSTALPFPKLYSIKLISILFDFLAGYLTFLIIRLKFKKGLNPWFSFLAVLFAPTVFLNSSFWAQCDAIYTTGLLASIYFLIKKRNGMAFVCYSIAFSFKLQALILMPLFLTVFLKKDVSIKYFLIIPVGYLIAMLPSVFLGRSLQDLLLIYWNQAHTYHVLTANAPNLYQWLPNEHYSVFVKIGMGFSLMVVFFFIFITYKSEEKMSKEIIIKFSLVCALIVPFFTPKMHERYFFPADLISIIYAFYFPQYFYLPIIIGLVSFFSYIPFLFGKALIGLQYLPFALLIVILITAMDLVRILHRFNRKISDSVVDEYLTRE